MTSSTPSSHSNSVLGAGGSPIYSITTALRQVVSSVPRRTISNLNLATLKQKAWKQGLRNNRDVHTTIKEVYNAQGVSEHCWSHRLAFLREARLQGRLVVFLDGLDESSAESRSRVAAWAQRTPEREPLMRVVLSSRPSGLALAPFAQAQFRLLKACCTL